MKSQRSPLWASASATCFGLSFRWRDGIKGICAVDISWGRAEMRTAVIESAFFSFPRPLRCLLLPCSSARSLAYTHAIGLWGVAGRWDISLTELRQHRVRVANRVPRCSLTLARARASPASQCIACDAVRLRKLMTLPYPSKNFLFPSSPPPFPPNQC